MGKEEIIKTLSADLNLDKDTAKKIIEKAELGGEINESLQLSEWYETRFLKNLVYIDEAGYTKMCIDALKIVSKTAGTDFGSSRQRDFAQLWSDMTRGYLGELAVTLFFKKIWNIDCELGHEAGNLKDYLPTDIHKIKFPSEEFRAPKLKIGIKTGKWNGIWFDIPGDQFNHSDIHIFVKVGTERDHLFSYFKSLSIFKDKILKKGLDTGALTVKESEDLYDILPNFKAIPAYVCGFVEKNSSYNSLPYGGYKGRIHFTVNSWNGPIKPGDLNRIKEAENVQGNVKFEGIGEFSHENGYLFNIGNLNWKILDWDKVIKRL